jgi:glycerol-3-phosphate acyltransferase PlsY
MLFLFFVMLIIAYLLGSLSSAIIVCKLAGLPDPRTTGSGNAGATNVLRISGGKKYLAIVVLIGDVLKGVIPVLLAMLIGINHFALGLIGLAALVGHIFPIFFKFHGGKGVATFLGVILVISPVLCLITIAVWIAVAIVTRYSSLSSLIAATVATLLSPWLAGDFSFFIPILLMTLLLFWRHMDNIVRLKEGTESKIGKNDLTEE